MNPDQNGRHIFKLCENGEIYDALEAYIVSCGGENEACEQTSKASAKGTRSKGACEHFPNLAGFCRFLKSSTLEFEDASREYPTQCSRILTVLEDEALNSGASPNLISSYLKRRLGYDSITKNASSDTQLQIHFEHDIFEDGG